MSPFNEYRKSYITVCFVVAAIYALVAGIDQPVFVCMTDGFIYSILIFSNGLFIWNIFRFAIPTTYAPTYRIISIVSFAMVTGLLIIGIETIAIYLCFPSYFTTFFPTLPVRLTITSLLYIITYLFYLYYKSIECNRKNFENDLSTKCRDESVMDNFENPVSDKSTNTTTPSTLDRITVRIGHKIKIIPLNSIIYIKADGDYISIQTADGRWLKEQTMKYTEDRLPIDNFVRVHRSYIVNIHHISRIERYGEQQLIILYNNEKIKISAARYHILKQILGV